MAKQSKKIEKETRRLIETITDMVKKKGDKYKFKHKNKKTIKKVKKTCVHWIIRKNKPQPLVMNDPENGWWRCAVCGARFPVSPFEHDEMEQACNTLLTMVNQMQFWAVKFGGDAEDTKMFLELKKYIPKFDKVSKAITKRLYKRAQWENNRDKTDAMNQFDMYAGFSYKP